MVTIPWQRLKILSNHKGLDFFFFTGTTSANLSCLYQISSDSSALEVTTDLRALLCMGQFKSLDLRDVEHNSQATMEAGLSLAKVDTVPLALITL
ncbi:hypothetical protein O9929_15565 [Vibrio lentus]|nr:hypothetical protein [Vibrio lentus]